MKWEPGGLEAPGGWQTPAGHLEELERTAGVGEGWEPVALVTVPCVPPASLQGRLQLGYFSYNPVVPGTVLGTQRALNKSLSEFITQPSAHSPVCLEPTPV